VNKTTLNGLYKTAIKVHDHTLVIYNTFDTLTLEISNTFKHYPNIGTYTTYCCTVFIYTVVDVIKVASGHSISSFSQSGVCTWEKLNCLFQIFYTLQQKSAILPPKNYSLSGFSHTIHTYTLISIK
jgi:hypothetical protein